MSCKCGSSRILKVSAKCSDLCFASFGDLEHDGYVPYIKGLDGGDYLSIEVCCVCGVLQGFETPMSDATIKKHFKEA